MRTILITAASVLAVAAVGIGATVAVRSGAPLELLTGDDPEPGPVILVIVGEPGDVVAVREYFPSEEILLSSPNAFALERGRIVATDVDAASAVLGALEWSERPIEIVRSSRGSKLGGSGSSTPETAADGGLTLAQLARKRVLTPGEAIRALRMLR